MKKFLDLATVTALILAMAVALRHYEVNKELGDLLRTFAVRIAPWVDKVVYS